MTLSKASPVLRLLFQTLAGSVFTIINVDSYRLVEIKFINGKKERKC